MTALIASIGGDVVAWVVGGLGVVLALFFAQKTIKASGAAEERAENTQKGLNDVATATKARSNVDALGDSAVDDRLRRFERK